MQLNATIATFAGLFTLAVFAGAARVAQGQTSSLYAGVSSEGAYLQLNDLPAHYRDLPQASRLQVHDLVTIRVDVRSITLAEGEVERRRNLLYDAVLRDWVILRGIDQINPSPQSYGDPRLQGQINGLFRAEGEIDTTEAVQFNITATIADIRPNGTLVLEAHKSIQVNDMAWDYSLSGVCRKEDIGPDNVLFSEKIAELSVFKRERGQIRDSYKRGWLLTFWDQVRLF